MVHDDWPGPRVLPVRLRQWRPETHPFDREPVDRRTRNRVAALYAQFGYYCAHRILAHMQVERNWWRPSSTRRRRPPLPTLNQIRTVLADVIAADGYVRSLTGGRPIEVS